MEGKKFSVHIGVGVFLMRGNNILLGKRCNTGYMDGKYASIGGHLEQNEDLKHTVIREALEEVGVEIKAEDLKFICLIRNGNNSDYINFFFMTDEFRGEPINMEKDKCDELIWKDISSVCMDELVAEKERRAIYNYLKDITYDEYGF